MPGAKKNFIGLEGFIWWIGVVEDRQDPEQLGRVRVRCFGWHTEEKNKIPTESLPWAHPVIPVNHPAAYTPKEGDMVFGFFMDGDSGQRPVIMGVLPGKPEKKPDYQKGFSDPRKSPNGPKKPDDSVEAYPKSKYLKEPTITRLARNKTDGTIVSTRKKNLQKSIKSAGGVTWSEPPPAYATKYPYNNALETESGHAFELDDSPGAERIQLAHRNGSYIEIDKDGNRAERVQKDNYEIIMGSDYVYIAGKCSITVGGDCNLKVSGKLNIEASEINMAASGDVKIKGGGAVKIESGSEMDLKAGGTAKFSSGGKLNLSGATAALGGSTVDIPAAKVGLQSGSVSPASGTGLSITAGAVAGAATGGLLGGKAGGAMGAALGALAGGVGGGTIAGVLSGGTIVGSLNAAVGKVAGGITSTISGVYNSINNLSDGLLKDFSSNLPIGELTNNVGIYQDIVNGERGGILGLKVDLKNTLLNKIDTIANKAIDRNIPFDLNADLQNAIYSVKNAGVNVLDYKLGKHIYPQTDTFYSANTSG